MAIIHECTQCGYEGRVTQVGQAFYCDRCDAALRAAEREDQPCARCGNRGVTETGLCYPCDHAPSAPTVTPNA